MSYKTILVHITPGTRCIARLDLAIKLAMKYDASLVALYALPPFIAQGCIMAQMGQEVIAIQKKAATELMAKTQEDLRKHTSSLDFENIKWLSSFDEPLDAICAQAKYADLVVIGQSDPSDDSGIPLDFPQQLILSAGRPILIVPYIGSYSTVGKNIIVAWNASREATRAVKDAIPLLKLAENVHVVAVDSGYGEHESFPCTDIVNYLAQHGVNVDGHRSQGGQIDIGNVLLSRAADISADLIVMGGYGHSRLREWVLGGATRTILESMTIPVLMSH
jgi:nucleotide-binding universal stress UspA family protein